MKHALQQAEKSSAETREEYGCVRRCLAELRATSGRQAGGVRASAERRQKAVAQPQAQCARCCRGQNLTRSRLRGDELRGRRQSPPRLLLLLLLLLGRSLLMVGIARRRGRRRRGRRSSGRSGSSHCGLLPQSGAHGEAARGRSAHSTARHDSLARRIRRRRGGRGRLNRAGATATQGGSQGRRGRAR